MSLMGRAQWIVGFAHAFIKIQFTPQHFRFTNYDFGHVWYIILCQENSFVQLSPVSLEIHSALIINHRYQWFLSWRQLLQDFSYRPTTKLYNVDHALLLEYAQWILLSSYYAVIHHAGYNCSRGYTSCADKSKCIEDHLWCQGFPNSECNDGSDQAPGCGM